MILNNLRVVVSEISDSAVNLQTDQGFAITVPRHVAGDVKAGDVLYLAADAKPLIPADQHAKDVLNELIKE